MRLLINSILAALLIVTVWASIFFKDTALTAYFDVSALSTYLRIISILWLILAIALALGFKRRIEMSQKYRQADKILAESKAAAKRKERAAMLLEEKLRAGYDRKVDEMRAEMDEMTVDYKKKLLLLKTQNLKLKDMASKLLKIVKKQECQNNMKSAVNGPQKKAAGGAGSRR